jgi:hypothetical protein
MFFSFGYKHILLGAWQHFFIYNFWCRISVLKIPLFISVHTTEDFTTIPTVDANKTNSRKRTVTPRVSKLYIYFNIIAVSGGLSSGSWLILRQICGIVNKHQAVKVLAKVEISRLANYQEIFAVKLIEA